MYTVRFWNVANECIWIGGCHSFAFESFDEAWDAANALLKAAVLEGAVEMDINNKFWDILDD